MAEQRDRDRSITSAKLASQAVRTAYIADGAVTAQKIAGGTAVVDADGNKVRSTARSARVLSPANWIYAVDFGADVSQCVLHATIGGPGTGNPPPGEIDVWSGGNPAVGTSVNEVIVQTNDSTGAPKKRPFHTSVLC